MPWGTSDGLRQHAALEVIHPGRQIAGFAGDGRKAFDRLVADHAASPSWAKLGRYLSMLDRIVGEERKDEVMAALAENPDGNVRGWVVLAQHAGTVEKAARDSDEYKTARAALLAAAEKATDAGDDPRLTEAGEQRAACLARTMRDAGVTHVFATTLQRTQQTVAPLADALGLRVELFAPDDHDGLLAALDRLPPGSVAVVAGHSNTLPTIATRLGAPLSGLDPEGDLPVYDRLDVVVRDQPEHATRLQLHYCAPDPG